MSTPGPAPTSGTTGPTSSAAPAAPQAPLPDIFDPSLIPSILPRIQRVLSLLQTAAQPGPEGALVLPAEGSANGDADGRGSSTQSQAQNGETEPAPRYDSAPSIALGQVSDDDTSLYDFLFSSAAGGAGGAGAAGNGAGAGGGARPTELSLALLKEARELRDVYRTAMRAAKGMPGGEWGEEEVKEMVGTLEEWRERER